MVLVLCFAIAYMIIRSVGQTTTNVAAIAKGQQPPYQGGKPVSESQAATASTAATTAGKATGGLGALIWSSLRDGAKAGWKEGQAKHTQWKTKRAVKKNGAASVNVGPAPTLRTHHAPEQARTAIPVDGVTVQVMATPTPAHTRAGATVEDEDWRIGALREHLARSDVDRAAKAAEISALRSELHKAENAPLAEADTAATQPTADNEKAAATQPHLALVAEPAPEVSSANTAGDVSARTTAESKNTMEGTPTMTTAMTSGEATNLNAARTYLGSLAEHVSSDIVPQMELCKGHMEAKNMDAETVGKLAVAMEQATSLTAAIQEVITAADKHKLMEEAVNSTEHVADSDYYKHQ